jgi:hypothetical protein
MVTSLAPSSQHMLYPTRARRCSTSPTTRRKGPRRISTPSSTIASDSTPLSKGGPWDGIQSEDRGHWRICPHEGRRRLEALVVLDYRRGNRLVLHSHSISGASKENEHEPSHTISARQITTSHTRTLGYSFFICCSLIIIYFSLHYHNIRVKNYRPS